MEVDLFHYIGKLFVKNEMLAEQLQEAEAAIKELEQALEHIKRERGIEK